MDLVEHEDCHHGGITALIIAFSNILRIGSLLVTVALESLWLRECKIIKAFLLSLQENLDRKPRYETSSIEFPCLLTPIL